jgi:23S rRNA pseudouridine1911/1915/1917 synthase
MSYADAQQSSAVAAPLQNPVAAADGSRHSARVAGIPAGGARVIEFTEWIVTVEQAGVRLDRFVSACTPSSSRALVNAAIEAGAVTVNRAVRPKAYRLAAGDAVSARGLRERSDIRVRPNSAIPLAVTFVDEDIVVIDKPAGLPVHPLRADEFETLAGALVARFPETADVGGDPLFPALVHRIDTDTSGIVVAARHVFAYDNLRAQFRGRKVLKTYVAIVHGRMGAGATVESLLSHDPRRRGRMRVMDEGAPPDGEQRFRAVSVIRAVARCAGFSRVAVEIRTGVTHQIRCQLAHIGHPIVGDRVYGLPEDAAEGRHFLHAEQVAFLHPRSGEPVEFRVPAPEAFDELWRRCSSSH